MRGVPEVLKQLVEGSIGQTATKRIRPAAQRGRECPQDAGVQDAALARSRVRPPIRPDQPEEVAPVAVDRPNGSERQYPFAQLLLGGKSESRQAVNHGHAMMQAGSLQACQLWPAWAQDRAVQGGCPA